jgi:DNA-binding transcriptional LysR family regulator
VTLNNDQIATFLAVHHHGSVEAAAEALDEPARTIRERITRLERSIGVPLIERYQQVVTLTSAGRRLLPHLRTMDQSVRDLRRATATLMT